MARRGTMFPTALLADKDFGKLTRDEQHLLVLRIWLSPHLDSAGFHPLQIGKWSRGFTPQRGEAETRELLGGLESKHWVAVDYDTEEVFLRPFIRMDASKMPQMYVSACRTIQAAQSPELRDAAWEQVLIVHPPELKPDPKRPQDVTDRLETQQNLAYEELRRFMERGTEGFGNPSRTLPEPSVVVTSAVTVSREGKGASADLGATIDDGVELCSICKRRPARKLQHSRRPDLCDLCVELEKHPSMRSDGATG